MFQKEKNLPNLISASRILGVGVLFWMAPFTTNIVTIWAVIIYSIIGFTDLLDGWVARRYNLVSDVGKILDPLADKILILIFLPLVWMHAIDAFPVFIILTREFAIMGLRVFSAKQGLIIAANMWGKIKTGITLPVGGILMGRVAVEMLPVPWYLKPVGDLHAWVNTWPSVVFDVLVWIMVAVTVASFLDYLFKFMLQIALQKNGGDDAAARKQVFWFVPNLITMLNFGCGVSAIYLGMQGSFRLAAGFVLLGVFLDAVDGKIARALGVFSQLGAKLDSRADYVTFGVAPAILIFLSLTGSNIPYETFLAPFLAVVFYAAVHYRLRRFNRGGHSDYFEGYPSPAGSSLVVILIGSQFLNGPIALSLMASFVSLIMVSTLKYPHNRIADRTLGFKLLRRPTLLYWFLTIGLFFGVPFPDNFFIPEMLLLLNLFYVLAPLLPEKEA